MEYWVGMAVLSVLTAEKGTKILSKCNKSRTMKQKKETGNGWAYL